MTAHQATRDGTVGPTTRPVAIPDDFDDAHRQRASGVVELPPHVRWSHPRRTYDLAVRRDRALLYEQVLAEGTDEDVRWYVNPDALVDLWDEIVLPSHVRAAWAAWLHSQRGLVVSC
ncbi:MAG: hypothetical protein ABIV94_07165 [Acidimicrobiales bacterium]